MRQTLLLCAAVVALAMPAPAGAQFGGADFSEWYTVANAASQGKTVDVVNLLSRGADADKLDSQGKTALIYASLAGNIAMANALIRYHAEVDFRDRFGNTALHWAASTGHIDVMKALLAAKAAVDAQNKQGITPLMLAADRGQTAAARLLLEQGANPKKQDFTGRDALGWASHPGVRQLLVEARQKG